MKTLITLLAATAVLGFAAPSTAKADSYCHGAQRIVSRLPCGTPVYAVYQVVGYDHCGRPVGQWVTQRANHSCGVCNPRPAYGYGQPGCNTGHSHGHHSSYGSPFFGRSRSGVSFSFGFGR
ncbi:MAG: hypothetical protein R3F13_11105 [Prosthecobacter sp.]